MEKDYEEHQQRKHAVRSQKEQDKQRSQHDKTYHTAAFDLQAVLTTPCSLVGELYYKRKLCCYNLSFYALGNKKGTCYLWDETHGQRGSCEVATCLLMYTSSVANKLSAVQEITYYSDTCGGQNRNQFVAAALLHALRMNNKLSIINHKFLEKGHSEMEVDSVHSTIESAKKRTKVFVPSQWHTVVTMARKVDPYVTVPLKYGDFLNLKELCKSCCPNMKKAGSERVNWLKVKWVQVRCSDLNCIFVNYTFDADNFLKINTQTSVNTRRSSEYKWPQSLSQCYTDKLPISAAKKQDLMSLCNSGIIPEEFHDYYSKIKTSKSVRD